MTTSRRALVVLFFAGMAGATACDGKVSTTGGEGGAGAGGGSGAADTTSTTGGSGGTTGIGGSGGTTGIGGSGGTTGNGGSGGTTGNGGSGGTTGIGGSGGTTGIGGSGGGSTCPSVYPEFLSLSTPDGGGPGPSLTVTAVAPDSLTMVSDSSGDEWTLTWAGADLTQHFAPGDPVTLESFPAGEYDSWRTVTGPTTYAAFWSSVQLGCCSEDPPPAPYGGPVLTTQLECYETYPCDNPSVPACYNLSAALVATSGDAQVIVGSFDTQPVGAYQVHNAGTISRQTKYELEHHVTVTVIGPVTP